MDKGDHRNLTQLEIDVLRDIERLGASLKRFLENLRLNRDVNLNPKEMDKALKDIQRGLKEALHSILYPDQ